MITLLYLWTCSTNGRFIFPRSVQAKKSEHEFEERHQYSTGERKFAEKVLKFYTNLYVTI